MRVRLHYILAILLMNALCAGPMLADALELKLDETLPGPAAVEAAVKPAVATATEASSEPVFSIGLSVLLLVCLAVYLGWRFDALKYYRTIVRVLSVSRRIRRAGSRQQGRKQPKPSPRPAQQRKSLPVRSHAPAKAMGDLAKAKQLLRDEAYDQAELFAMSAVRSEPYNLDAYVVALRILSSYQTPQLIGLVRGGLQLLRLKNPPLWRDVAEQGRKLVPELEDWDDEPDIKLP